MNNSKALENAKEFIEYNITKNLANHNLNKPIDVIFSNEVLNTDPNLKILKFELNKIGYSITQNEDNSKWWVLSKN